jgi:hypothetical protein
LRTIIPISVKSLKANLSGELLSRTAEFRWKARDLGLRPTTPLKFFEPGACHDIFKAFSKCHLHAHSFPNQPDTASFDFPCVNR